MKNETVSLEVAIEAVLRNGPTFETIAGLCKMAVEASEAQQEPVAVVSGYYGGQCVILPIDPARIFNSNTALYTTPPQRTWVGLTDEDKHEIELRAGITEDDDGYIVSQVFKLTEAKLKEKNT